MRAATQRFNEPYDSWRDWLVILFICIISLTPRDIIVVCYVPRGREVVINHPHVVQIHWITLACAVLPPEWSLERWVGFGLLRCKADPCWHLGHRRNIWRGKSLGVGSYLKLLYT